MRENKELTTRLVIPIPQPEQPDDLRQPKFQFTEKDGMVAVIAETTADHIAAFRNVTEELDEHYWAQAAVAASLSKKYGNGEYGRGEMEKLGAAVELSTSYLFKIARTYSTFSSQNYPRVHNLYFKHHVIACGYKDPNKALSVAVERGLSCNALAEWVAEENRKNAKKISRQRQEQVKTDFLTHLEHVESVIEEDFIAMCPSKDFAKRVYQDWLNQIKFELRQLLRGANFDKIRAAIEDEGAQTLAQIKSLTGLAMFDVEAAVAQMVAQNEYEWIDRGGKKDDQRGQPEKILHKVGESDGTGFTVARPVNSYAH